MVPRIRTLYLGLAGAAGAILLVLALGVAVAFWTAEPAYAQDPKDTGRIAIHKTVCEDIGQQNTCKGRDKTHNDEGVDFAIYEGDSVTPESTPIVVLGDNHLGNGNMGAGSQGRIVSEPLPTGTYTVCEVDDDFTSTPRPPAGGGGSTGGVNQEPGSVEGNTQCITVELNSGQAQLKFLNQAVPTATPPGQATPTPTNTPSPTNTPVPGQPTSTPVPGQPEQPTSTPVPGQVVAQAPTATPVVQVLPAVQPTATPSVIVLPAAGSGGLADTGLPLSLVAVNGLALAGLALAALAGWRRRQ